MLSKLRDFKDCSIYKDDGSFPNIRFLARLILTRFDKLPREYGNFPLRLCPYKLSAITLQLIWYPWFKQLQDIPYKKIKVIIKLWIHLITCQLLGGCEHGEIEKSHGIPDTKWIHN